MRKTGSSANRQRGGGPASWRLIERIAVAKTSTQVQDWTAAVLRAHGLDGLFIATMTDARSLPVRGAVLLDDRDLPWREAYEVLGGPAADPFLLAAARLSDPVTWRGLIETVADYKLSNHYRLAQEQGRSDGLVVPIAAGEALAVAVMASPEDISFPAEDLRRVTLAVVVACQRLMILRRSATDQVASRLSPREAEVLRWIKAGKSDWQIGRILEISPKTVNFHVENVKRKLGVATRMQAVVAALASGGAP